MTRNSENSAVAAEENMATSVKRAKFFTRSDVPEFGSVLSSPNQNFAAGAEGYFYEILGVRSLNDAFRFLGQGYRLSNQQQTDNKRSSKINLHYPDIIDVSCLADSSRDP